MSTAENDLKNFTAFVHERIASGEATELGRPELFDLWRLQNPSNAEHVTHVAAINAFSMTS